MAGERRRSARVAILGRLHGHAVSLDIPVKVSDLSLAGMAIETPMPFPVGAIQEFELTLGDETAVVLRGHVVRSHNISPPGAPAVFVTGVQFVDDEPAESSEVGQLIERLD
jgi:hypothetical protein